MQKLKNVLKLTAYGFIMLLVTLCIYTFIMTDIMKKEYVNIFGYTYYVVATGSMSGTIEVNDIIFVKLTDKVEINDIVTYKDKDGAVVTHRLVEKRGNELITKGDVNNTQDEPIRKKDLIGKVSCIISPSFILKVIASFLIVFILLAFINFDKIIKKYVVKNTKDNTNDTVPENIFSSTKLKEEEKSSGSTITIPLEEIEKIKKIQEREVEEDEMIEVLEVEEVIDINSNNIIKKETNNIKEKEKELLELISNLLRIKNNALTTTRINKKWLNRFQYVYKLAHIVLLNDSMQLEDTIEHPTFKEIYDYDLDKIGLYENLRNKIYEMPIYVFLRILSFAILYNDAEFFDGVYKIMKYKIKIDQNNSFKQIRKNDNHGKKQLRLLIEFMKKISVEFDNQKVFELERIERLVKIKNYANK